MNEIGALILIGIVAQWVAWRFRVPAILPLILAGLAVGPVAEYFRGEALIIPRYDREADHGLFPGDLLFKFVNLAIGLILFEGGLTLNRNEIKGQVRTIGRLVTLGPIITAIVGAVAAHYIVGISWLLSFMFSTLIVVTGPTVIAPIMRQLNLKRQVGTVLKWESIIIDPLGAFMAVLMFDLVKAHYTTDLSTSEALLEFVRLFLVGAALGGILGYLLYQLIKRLFIPQFLLNVATLALVIGAFMLSDLLVPESGLLTAVIMGATLGNLDVPHFREILDFKESLTILLISLLFILLSANMSVEQLLLVWRPESLLLLLIIIFVARPLSVFTSLSQSDLSWKDKAFISWVGPRGIVAAGVASLFGLEMEEFGVPEAEMITPLVFMIVLGTVLLNATLAGPVGRWLKVVLPEGSGVLIFGGSEGARTIAKDLQDSGRRVIMVSSSRANVTEAKEAGLDMIHTDVYDETLLESNDLNDIGFLLALSGSEEDNFYALNRLKEYISTNRTLRLITKKEQQGNKIGSQALFSPFATYLLLNRMARQYPQVQQIELEGAVHFRKVLEELRQEKQIPLYVRCGQNNDIRFITANGNLPGVDPEDVLHYIGDSKLMENVPTHHSKLVADAAKKEEASTPDSGWSPAEPERN